MGCSIDERRSMYHDCQCVFSMNDRKIFMGILVILGEQLRALGGHYIGSIIILTLALSFATPRTTAKFVVLTATQVSIINVSLNLDHDHCGIC
jgi:hypothetical protein